MSQPSPAIITNKKLKSYLHRLACVQQHIRGIQAKLYICNEDARKFYETEGINFLKKSYLMFNLIA